MGLERYASQAWSDEATTLSWQYRFAAASMFPDISTRVHRRLHWEKVTAVGNVDDPAYEVARNCILPPWPQARTKLRSRARPWQTFFVSAAALWSSSSYGHTPPRRPSA